MTDDTEDLDGDYEPFTPEQVLTLWLLGSSQHGWELASDVPQWVKDDALAQGLAFESAPGLWRKTLRGDRHVKRRMGD